MFKDLVAPIHILQLIYCHLTNRCSHCVQGHHTQ
ncbi:Uncharacterised protein [Vibrio cholerae]|nr:Uncharacterised protein [Vibrio cholerae]